MDGPQLFTQLFGGGNRLRQTGYTFLIFFLEKGSITPDQEIGPPNFDNVVAPLIWRRGDGAIAPPPTKKARKIFLNVSENKSSDTKLSLIPFVSSAFYVE